MSEELSEKAPSKPPNKCLYYCRMLIALVSCILLFVGVAMQVFSASNLYGVPLGLMCKSTTGSDVLQEREGFTVIIKDVLDQRKKCLGAGSQICMNPRQVWPMCDEIETCCKASGSGSSKSPWYVRGVCARPWLSGFSLSNTTGLSLMETMDLFTAVMGELVGVDKPYNYGLANSEFWCKNCPNNGLLHCPFNPNAADAAYSDCCAGGSVSKAGEAFWAMSPETQISGKYILCSDQAKVYRAWIEALFPLGQNGWTKEHYGLAEARFYRTCFSRKGSLGFILSCGPVLGVLSILFTLVSLIPKCSTSGMPQYTYNLILLTMSMTLISMWPITFTGAATLVSRYSFCWGLQDTNVVVNASKSTMSRAAPVLFTGQPCMDINSEGQRMNNPFIETLATWNAGYVTGGVIMMIALVAMLYLVSKHADVVLELKLERGLDPKFYQQMAMQGVEMTKTGVSLAASGVQQGVSLAQTGVTAVAGAAGAAGGAAGARAT